jgi:oxygen-independent coproporphyrinogen-3 oxidase
MEINCAKPTDKPSIETVYLGGGTPSQLSEEQLHQLFFYINKVYGMEQVKEVTLECNPDDVTEAFAKMLQKLPVNRISMGAQTFSNERLHFLRRRHTAEQVALAVERLRKAGIGNISIDLMYSFPNETLSDWQHDIDAALQLNVEHLSAYALMFEEGTPLYRLLENGKVTEPDEELSLQMYTELIDRLTVAGFEHYEISNFAKPNFRSRHNSSYWNQTPYIGLGAAAHSYDGKSRRWWNIDNVEAYMKGIEDNRNVCEQELLDEATRYNEKVMTALRTCEGLDMRQLSPQQAAYCKQQAQRFIDDGLLSCQENRLRLTRRGLFVSNMVMSELMMVETP